MYKKKHRRRPPATARPPAAAQETTWVGEPFGWPWVSFFVAVYMRLTYSKFFVDRFLVISAIILAFPGNFL